MAITIAAIVALIVLFLLNAIRIVREYERGVIFRLGRLIGAKGPGIFLIIPIVDKMIRVNLRSEKNLEEAERLLWEAKMQKGVNQLEIERVLSELGEMRKNLTNQDNGKQEGN